MKLTFPSTLYTSHSSAAQPLRHRKKFQPTAASAPSGRTRPRRSPAPVPPGRCPDPFGPCPASGGSYPADDPSTSGYPTSGRCAHPFPKGRNAMGPFRRRTICGAGPAPEDGPPPPAPPDTAHSARNRAFLHPPLSCDRRPPAACQTAVILTDIVMKIKLTGQ